MDAASPTRGCCNSRAYRASPNCAAQAHASRCGVGASAPRCPDLDSPRWPAGRRIARPCSGRALEKRQDHAAACRPRRARSARAAASTGPRAGRAARGRPRTSRADPETARGHRPAVERARHGRARPASVAGESCAGTARAVPGTGRRCRARCRSWRAGRSRPSGVEPPTATTVAQARRDSPPSRTSFPALATTSSPLARADRDHVLEHPRAPFRPGAEIHDRRAALDRGEDADGEALGGPAPSSSSTRTGRTRAPGATARTSAATAVPCPERAVHHAVRVAVASVAEVGWVVVTVDRVVAAGGDTARERLVPQVESPGRARPRPRPGHVPRTRMSSAPICNRASLTPERRQGRLVLEDGYRGLIAAEAVVRLDADLPTPREVRRRSDWSSCLHRLRGRRWSPGTTTQSVTTFDRRRRGHRYQRRVPSDGLGDGIDSVSRRLQACFEQDG